MPACGLWRAAEHAANRIPLTTQRLVSALRRAAFSTIETMSEQTPHTMPEAAQPYYERHIFFCLNQRSNGDACCASLGAQQGFDRCKAQVKDKGLNGKGHVRVNKAGCLDRCAGGPVAVVYPEGVWYTFVDNADIDEIVDTHLVGGPVVQRLVLPDNVGR
jgi:(2Fe-2S) ferredoxin